MFTQADLDFTEFLTRTVVQARKPGGGAFLRRNEFIPTPAVTKWRDYDQDTDRQLAIIHRNREGRQAS